MKFSRKISTRHTEWVASQDNGYIKHWFEEDEEPVIEIDGSTITNTSNWTGSIEGFLTDSTLNIAQSVDELNKALVSTTLGNMSYRASKLESLLRNSGFANHN